jgi:hypothetical protein
LQSIQKQTSKSNNAEGIIVAMQVFTNYTEKVSILKIKCRRSIARRQAQTPFVQVPPFRVTENFDTDQCLNS